MEPPGLCRFAIDLSRFASSKVPTPIFFLSKQDLTAVARTYNRFAGRLHASCRKQLPKRRFARIAQNYAVRVSEVVRKILARKAQRKSRKLS